MNREIPGYYYDEEKKKYFKIESSRSAPAQAAWSASSVKRRLVETEEEELKRENLARNSGRVKRATLVWDEPLMGGCFLGREARGGAPGGKLEDMRGEAWTMGLRDKGTLRMWPNVAEDRGSVTAMYIGGEEMGAEGGMGMAYACHSDELFASSYISRDEQDDINFRKVTARSLQTDIWPSINLYREVTSFKYHAPSHNILVASPSWMEQGRVSIYYTPVGSVGDRVIAYNITAPPRGRLDFEQKRVNTLTPAPASSPLTCVAGTNKGIVKWQDDKLSWLTPPGPPPLPRFPSSRHFAVHPIRSAHSRGSGRNISVYPSIGNIDNRDDKIIHGEIYSLDFHRQNPADVIIAGGLSRHICLIDMRCAEREWMTSYIQHTSSVAHVKSISEYEVLAAGPMNAMAIYDVRFDRYCNHVPDTAGCGDHHPYPHMRGGYGSNKDTPSLYGSARRGRAAGARTAMPVRVSMPVVQFPEYKNGPHLRQIGFDVLHGRDNAGAGIVAAAHDDGTVGLFSLRSGRKLRSPGIDAIRLPGIGNIVKSLMFQTLPGDVHPSLFVGQGSVVKKYSFGMGYSKKGGRVFEEEDWGGEVC